MTVVFVRHSGARDEAEETKLNNIAQVNLSGLGDCWESGTS